MGWNIRGMPVGLHVKTESGRDALNNPVYADSVVTVENVLVARPESADEARALDLYGKRLAYVLGIPKGDAHAWENTEVDFFGDTFRTFGFPEVGIEENVPGPWHKKVYVEAYA